MLCGAGGRVRVAIAALCSKTVRAAPGTNGSIYQHVILPHFSRTNVDESLKKNKNWIELSTIVNFDACAKSPVKLQR